VRRRTGETGVEGTIGNAPNALVGLCGEGTFDRASRLRIAVGGVENDAETGVRGEDGGKENAVPRGDERTTFESVLSSQSSMASRPVIERQ